MKYENWKSAHDNWDWKLQDARGDRTWDGHNERCGYCLEFEDNSRGDKCKQCPLYSCGECVSGHVGEAGLAARRKDWSNVIHHATIVLDTIKGHGRELGYYQLKKEFKVGDVCYWDNDMYGHLLLAVIESSDHIRLISFYSSKHGYGYTWTFPKDDMLENIRHATAADMEKCGFEEFSGLGFYVDATAHYAYGSGEIEEKNRLCQLADGSWWWNKEDKKEEVKMKETEWEVVKQYVQATPLLKTFSLKIGDRITIESPVDVEKRRREATVSKEWLEDNAPYFWKKHIEPAFGDRDKISVREALGYAVGIGKLTYVLSFFNKHDIVRRDDGGRYYSPTGVSK